MTVGDAAGLLALRGAFPVLRRLAYLNAGTNGPIAAESGTAARAALAHEEAEGRSGMPHFLRVQALADALRAGYAERLGCGAEDVAITTSATDGVGRALLALELRPGDEVLTGDEEHPGVLGPLAAQRARGVEVRVAPFGRLHEAVGSATRAVVCSHVSWRSGALAPPELAEVDVPLVFDGAQGVGAVPTDPVALGAAFYAAAGQKWLCGPEGIGLLYVAPAVRERLRPPAPGYRNLEDPLAGLDARPHASARAYDTSALSTAAIAFASAALDVLGAAGWDDVHAHAADLTERAATALTEHGREVLPRDRTTLVTWREPDAEAAVEQLAAAGVVVRSLPGEDLVRASFGGWSTHDDLDRLLTALPR
jgi:selenocysteine lyase/cysteine desulfurase